MSPANGEQRQDCGLFGPDTVAWEVIGHPVTLIGGMQVPLRIVARAAIATVPRHLRALAGIEGPRSVDAVTVAAVRPAAAALTLPRLRDAPALVLGAEVRAMRDSARALAA
ncbi:MAG TPA: hypothetical protein VGN71_00555 [Solirubrobacteraceae bacterium]|nr:hypothetical protein [Solirubrobacteraceae bacterium]